MKTKFLINLIIATIIVHASADLRFEHINQFTKHKIARIFLDYVKSEDCYPCLLSPRSEGIFYSAWNPSFCTETDFLDNRRRGYFPTSVVWDGFHVFGLNPIWINEKLGKNEELKAPTQLLNDYRKGLLVPIISLGNHPLFTFLAQESKPVCGAKFGYAYITNLTFYIEGIEKVNDFKCRLSSGQRTIVDMRSRINKRCETVSPPITLTRREATEIVYLTALCRGKVKSLDEFNAAFVPKGETFLVKLTAAECETEIGQMLYKLAQKRKLFRR